LGTALTAAMLFRDGSTSPSPQRSWKWLAPEGRASEVSQAFCLVRAVVIWGDAML
jgi:hypothetical protein